jgi:ubiquinone/menaquinone biosynthesis C-methylase UbiE
MLKKARETIPEKVLWLEEDFENLPFLESSFDLVISGFTLRSVQNIPEFLKKVRRILSPGGKAVFLDLTRPRDLWARVFFYPYLKWFLPLIGWLVSGNGTAYGFLARSVAHFQSAEKTLGFMTEAGFKDCSSKPFSFGAVTLIMGSR